MAPAVADARPGRETSTDRHADVTDQARSNRNLPEFV